MIQQPHFDDELSVLTAQPVVPLEEISMKVRARRRWFLGGAFAIAMLLGAASAVISAYFKFRNLPDPEIQSLSVSPALDESVVPTIETVSEKPVVKTIKLRRPQPNVSDTDNSDYSQLNEKDALKRIRDAVLVDEWQERRPRRVERRNSHHNRNLSNIDEIFEGVHHP